MERNKTGIHRLEGEIPPTILTIFGATGDLSADYLLPALLHIERMGLFPSQFKLVCVGRRDFDTKQFVEFIFKKSNVLKKLGILTQARLLKRLTYYRGDMEVPASFAGLAKLLAEDDRGHHCYNRLYYFATWPEFFPALTRILKRSGLLVGCEAHERTVRVLIEKPFGSDLPSARALNRLLLRYFSEEQIYRIDHYQGKETVQNLMVVRFANRLFEPLWNREYIDHIEISVLEEDSAGVRSQFYGKTGALRDMVQNHILQMLALLAMDEPRELATELIRDKKAAVLKALVPFERRAVGTQLVRGQYRGFAREAGRKSKTETFVALKLFLNLPRWRGVPFYVCTGKRLSHKVAELSIHFKELPVCLFRGCRANILTFRIQPDESVYLQINNKIPGFGIRLHQADLEFSYQQTFRKKLPTAYERLLLDFIQGDQRLFIRSDEIEAAWKFIDSIRRHWNSVPLHRYAPGSSGPEAAAELMKRDGREWWTK